MQISSSSKEKGESTPAALFFCFVQLRKVCVEDFVPTEPNFEFLRSILMSSPHLQTLTISSEQTDYSKEDLVEHLYQLSRASAVVQINHL
jgi:hypothetical protein